MSIGSSGPSTPRRELTKEDLSDMIEDRDETISRLRSALHSIKRMCSAERQANWETLAASTQTRMRIADLCELDDAN